jgi:hypothetical protein
MGHRCSQEMLEMDDPESELLETTTGARRLDEEAAAVVTLDMRIALAGGYFGSETRSGARFVHKGLRGC